MTDTRFTLNLLHFFIAHRSSCNVLQVNNIAGGWQKRRLDRHKQRMRYLDTNLTFEYQIRVGTKTQFSFQRPGKCHEKAKPDPCILRSEALRQMLDGAVEIHSP